MEAAGWYHAEGDPEGTVRYWSGQSWVGGPVAQSQSTGAVQAPTDVALASPGTRIGGRIIDVLIYGVIWWAFVFVTAGEQISDSMQSVITGATTEFELPFVVMLIGAVLPFAWNVLWIIFAGGTPGKLILGMRVADAKAPVWQRANGQEAALRSLNSLLAFATLAGATVASLGNLVSLGIGLASLIMLFTDDLHRTVMDRVGSTLIVKKEYMGEPRAGAPQGVDQ